VPQAQQQGRFNPQAQETAASTGSFSSTTVFSQGGITPLLRRPVRIHRNGHALI